MRGFPKSASLAAIAAVSMASAAAAADLSALYKAPPMVAAPAFSWSGFYGGIYGGANSGGPNNYGLVGDPPGVNAVGAGPAANGGQQPVYSTVYNNLASGGVGQVSNTIIPGGVNCALFTNCNTGGAAATNITPNTNTGYRTDSMLPSSLNGGSQSTALYGFEIGLRQQFDHVVLGVGADITGFEHRGSTSYNSTGSFFNSNGFTANSQALGCIDGVLPFNTCQQAQFLNTSGSVGTVNTGGSNLNLAISSSPNWLGTVRGSLGYAWDRLMIFGSGGLAYSTAGLNVTGAYNDKVTSNCSGVSNVYAAAGNNNGGAVPGTSFVGYQCGTAAVNSASVNQLTTTSVTYSGNHGGGMLTGFAAGTGAAYAVTDHITLLVEGLYYNLGTVKTTVTGSGTQTTTTTVSGAVGTANGGVTPTPSTVTTTTAAVTASPFTVSKMIDGMMLKGGVQYKF